MIKSFLPNIAKHLSRNIDRLLKLIQICALLWIAFELQNLNSNVYSGPNSYDASVDAINQIGLTLKKIDSNLDSIGIAITLRP